MAEPRPTFGSMLLQSCPPWLQRLVGERFILALGTPIDGMFQRTAESVKQRFPNVVDDSSLGVIGRERRIRPGPLEEAETYASRLQGWWDVHRIRGGPYALIWNLHHFFLRWLPGRKDVVYHSGTRRWVDADGDVTRDSITWDADGTDKWAQFWVFFYLPDLIEIGSDFLITDGGDYIITDGGSRVVVTRTISPGEITREETALFTTIPREWSAAHVATITVVLLWSTRRLWNYPQPVPTWAEWGASGALWGEAPVIARVQ